MSTQRLSGSFAQKDLGLVIADSTDASLAPQWTLGAVRTSRLSAQPSLLEDWRVLGFSIRCQLAASAAPTSWGYVGDLWAGLAVNGTLQDANAAVLPQDLSTFAKVFSGADEPLPQFNLASPAQVQGGLNGTTFIFPTPIDMLSGSQLEMALILTPSLCVNLSVVVVSADYTLLYERA